MVQAVTTFVPHATEQDHLNLGAEYNRMMEISPTEWVCFMDHDCMWLQRDWYSRVIRAINRAEEMGTPGLISTRATRIAREEQTWGKLSDVHDIMKLRKMAALLRTKDPKPATGPVSGVVIITSRTAWKAAGGFPAGFLGVDWEYTQRVKDSGRDVLIMQDCPVYHWHRADKDMEHVRQANALHANPYRKRRKR